jgi:hypothetical protein
MPKDPRNWLIGVSLVVFVVWGIVWFIVASDGGGFDAGKVFVGLAYAVVVVFGVLLILLVAKYLENNRAKSTQAADPAGEAKEQTIVIAQLGLGALLIVLGAAFALVFGLVIEDGGLKGQKALALAIGTAVIGAGAAMLPPGAAAGADARMKRRPKRDRQRDQLRDQLRDRQRDQLRDKRRDQRRDPRRDRERDKQRDQERNRAGSGRT